MLVFPVGKADAEPPVLPLQPENECGGVIQSVKQKGIPSHLTNLKLCKVSLESRIYS